MTEDEEPDVAHALATSIERARPKSADPAASHPAQAMAWLAE